MTNPGNKAVPAPGHRFAILYPLSYISCALALAGCTGPKPLKGGKAVTARTPGGTIVQTLAQGENPSAPSRQTQETVKVRAYTLPAGTRIQELPSSSLAAPTSPAEARRRGKPGEGGPHTSFSAACPPSAIHYPLSAFVLSAPVPVTEREETRASTELGAAQKDTAREFTAKLSSLKSIVWVGLALFIFGIASFAWPPLRAIIGSVTTSAAITLGGVALMILPTLIVGHELLILAGVALSVGLWFLAHRHGQLRGLLSAVSSSSSSSSSSPASVSPGASLAAPTSPAEAMRRGKPSEGGLAAPKPGEGGSSLPSPESQELKSPLRSL